MGWTYHHSKSHMSAEMGTIVDGDPCFRVSSRRKCFINRCFIDQAGKGICNLAIDATRLRGEARTDVDSQILEGAVRNA